MEESRIRFGIDFRKLDKGDFQLGVFLNSRDWSGVREYYLYICFIKWNMSIGKFAH